MALTLKSLAEKTQSGQFEEALSGLEQLSSSLGEANYFFQKGGIYLQMEELGLARYYLESARLAGHFSSELGHNLNFILSQTGHLTGELSRSPASIDRFLSLLSAIPNDAFFIFSLFLALIAAFVHLKKGFAGSKSYFFAGLIIAAPLLGVFVKKMNPTAIIVKESVTREGPSSIYAESGRISSGVKVVIGRRYNGKTFIKRPARVSGWVIDEALKSFD